MADSSVTTQVVIAALGAGGAGAIIAAIVTGLFSKRKLGAEAAQIITNAAAGVVTQLNDELRRSQDTNERQRTDHERQVMAIRADHERQVEQIETRHSTEMRDIRATLQLHVAWDTLALSKLHEIGIDLPPVPPLLPPTLSRG
jgi:uncharacterized membrane protein YebE (DUF533 family)